MYDKERISLIIRDIETYFRELECMKIRDLKDLDNIKFRAASMNIFSIINRSLDLAEEIVTSKNLGFPMQYKELFDFLSKDKIISKKNCEELKDLVILRNKISHRYGSVNEKDILNSLDKIKIVKNFIEEVKNEIKKG